MYKLEQIVTITDTKQYNRFMSKNLPNIGTKVTIYQKIPGQAIGLSEMYYYVVSLDRQLGWYVIGKNIQAKNRKLPTWL